MKASELMIGDWVRVRLPWRCPVDGRLEIRTYTHRVAGVRTYGPDADTIYIEAAGVRPQDIEPIPLTPEIFENNGFIVGSFWAEYKDDDCTIELFGENISIKNGRGPWLRGKWSFVHELQHALRLCGIDKELTL